MTYAPQSLKDAQIYLHDKTGLPWVSLGIVGDVNHHGGYHQGEGNVSSTDYSVDESSRDSRGLTGAASAIDIGSFSRLREMSVWIVDQCKVGAADTLDIREVIYSPDGRTVKRWDRLGRRSTGDSSHLTHTHISYHRDSEARDKTGLFRRFFGDAPSTIAGGIMLPKQGDKNSSVGYWQGLLDSLGYELAVDDDYGSKTTAAVHSWHAAYLKRHGSTLKPVDGKTITPAVAREIQVDFFARRLAGLIKGDRGPAGPAGPAGKDGRDGVLQLPATVEIHGQVTSLAGGE